MSAGCCILGGRAVCVREGELNAVLRKYHRQQHGACGQLQVSGLAGPEYSQGVGVEAMAQVKGLSRERYRCSWKTHVLCCGT